MASTSSKSLNPFARQGTNLDFFQDSFLPKYYEQDLHHRSEQTPTFKSVSPKIYHEKQDYFTNELDELNDDSDALYEQTLLNSNFFAENKKEEVDNHALQRLRQILDHMNPNYYQQPPFNSNIPASVRSQFSSSSSTTASSNINVMMRSISIPDHRDSKGKGKMNSPF